MVSTQVLLLQLLLVSLASASHHFGGSSSFTYKGRNPDGTFRLNIRNRGTFDGCNHFHRWNCYSGNCGNVARFQRGVIDSSTNAPRYNRQWCETETVETRNVPSDSPLQMRAVSCCWIGTRNSIYSWHLMTSVDLGTRSDTWKPNRSPEVSILPFLRVPQNCPRTYRLMSFDPDGDNVRCRYGNIRHVECNLCDRPSGFTLDQDACTLHYNRSTPSTSVFGFEMVVEDFPRGRTNLSYSDGSSTTFINQLPVRRKRQALWRPATALPATTPWWWNWRRPTTTAPTTTTTPWWWNWRRPTTTAPSTTTDYTTTTAWPTTTTAQTTTTAPSTTTDYTTTTAWPNATTAQTTTTAPSTTTAYTMTTAWPNTTTAQTTTTARPRTTFSTGPLSKLPLQFSFLVDPPAPSCQEGRYLPRFVHPTPNNGEHFQAEVQKELEIRVKAQATNSIIDDLIMTGPLNINKHTTTHGEFVIRWTPVPDDLGEYFPICFAVESRAGFAVYQSEMRCVLVKVTNEGVKSNVTCSESTMTVAVEKTSMFGSHEGHFQLNDPSNTVCTIQSNSTHIFAIVPLNACGTQIEEDADNLIFRNEITTFDNISRVITRKHLLAVEFSCQYSKRGNLTLSFMTHRAAVTVMEKGFGTFTYQFEFYPNDQFQTMIDPRSYPLEYDIGNKIFIQIEATSSVNNTQLFVESCSAAPYDIPNYMPTYPIIENGCNMDSTIETYSPANKTQFRFSIEAFKFIGMHDQVYISCSVMMCEAGNANTRCSMGCINSTSGHGHRNNKRSVATQTSRHFISQGPLRLRRSAQEGAGSSVVNLNLNLVFIAGCVLAAVAMISAVAIYKAKVSRAGYQRLSTDER